jgi:sugar O-acyltransferase (sialic acid O-acetyltransferase NeuD family)
MKPIIIVGNGKIAEVVLYFFENHSERKVAAAAVDEPYRKSSDWCGLALVDFEKIEMFYPPSEYDAFVAVGYQEINQLRETLCMRAREKGYDLVSYVHPDAGVPSDCIYGDNCFLMNNVCIHPKVSLGANVFVWSGAMIGHHSIVGNNCWLTSSCNISGGVTLGDNCFLAVNSTIANDVTLGNECLLGANALVTKCASARTVYLEGATAPFRLNTSQFLKISRFGES